MMRPAERTTLRRARLSCLVLFTYEVQILPVRMLGWCMSSTNPTFTCGAEMSSLEKQPFKPESVCTAVDSWRNRWIAARASKC